jgi:hypothetical protein
MEQVNKYPSFFDEIGRHVRMARLRSLGINPRTGFQLEEAERERLSCLGIDPNQFTRDQNEVVNDRYGIGQKDPFSPSVAVRATQWYGQGKSPEVAAEIFDAVIDIFKKRISAS